MARILVIDDEPLIRKYLRALLEPAGHEVVEAGDGIAGLKAFQSQPADLVFCDLFMPLKEGLETIRELRQLAHAVPIVAMSGGTPLGAMDFLPVATRMGATRIMAKPFSKTEACAVIDELLGRSS